MVKTTIVLEDGLYRDLVNESVREYGSTRKLSLLINRKLRNAEVSERHKKTKRLTIKLGRKITEKEIEKALQKGFDDAIRWSV